MFTNTRELANHILKDIGSINPYTEQQRHLAYVWAVGFLARVIAEIIWRDSRALEIYKQARDRASQKVAPLLDKRPK